MKLKELKCPFCGEPIKAKERDMMLKCTACGKVGLYTKEKGLTQIDYTIAKSSKTGSGELIYVPFWLVDAEPIVRNEEISGGGIRRFVKGEKKMRGRRIFYVCASLDIPEEFSRIWNMDLTVENPQFETEPEFKGSKRARMTMEEETSGDNAEFLFLRYETELTGTLQRLDYDFKVFEKKTAYIPAYRVGSKYVLGI